VARFRLALIKVFLGDRVDMVRAGARAKTYLDASEALLAEAEELLASGDLREASEKFWGAVVQAVKAVAEARGWEHYRHHHISRAISRLVAETGDVELSRLFSSAERLHANFYEGFMSELELRAHAEDARRLVGKLGALLAS